MDGWICTRYVCLFSSLGRTPNQVHNHSHHPAIRVPVPSPPQSPKAQTLAPRLAAFLRAPSRRCRNLIPASRVALSPMGRSGFLASRVALSPMGRSGFPTAYCSMSSAPRTGDSTPTILAWRGRFATTFASEMQSVTFLAAETCSWGW